MHPDNVQWRNIADLSTIIPVKRRRIYILPTHAQVYPVITLITFICILTVYIELCRQNKITRKLHVPSSTGSSTKQNRKQVIHRKFTVNYTALFYVFRHELHLFYSLYVQVAICIVVVMIDRMGS